MFDKWVTLPFKSHFQFGVRLVGWLSVCLWTVDTNKKFPISKISLDFKNSKTKMMCFRPLLKTPLPHGLGFFRFALKFFLDPILSSSSHSSSPYCFILSLFNSLYLYQFISSAQSKVTVKFKSHNQMEPRHKAGKHSCS